MEIPVRQSFNLSKRDLKENQVRKGWLGQKAKWAHLVSKVFQEALDQKGSLGQEEKMETKVKWDVLDFMANQVCLESNFSPLWLDSIFH